MSTPLSSHQTAQGKPRLLDQVRDTIRVKHYSPKTEDAYIGWIRRFIFYHGQRHPAEMGADQVAQFLSHLALERRVAASTQNQAFNALVFLYHQVLHIDLGTIVRSQHERDLHQGLGRVPLPAALARKYPNAEREWGWQWVFPAATHFIDGQTGVRHRFHLHESAVQKAAREVARKTDISKHVTPHVFRPSFATDLLVDNYDILTLQ